MNSKPVGPSELGFCIAKRLSEQFGGGKELPTSMLHLIANMVDSELASRKQQWLNSVTAACADFPNVASYIAQLEEERDKLVSTLKLLAQVDDPDKVVTASWSVEDWRRAKRQYNEAIKNVISNL